LGHKKSSAAYVNAAVSSMAQVSARRSLCFVDDIVIETSWARPLGLIYPI